MAQGTTTVNFGAFPGSGFAQVDVTGQAGITTSNLVEAWIYPVATADHTADEHLVETLVCTAGNIVNGVGFTIYVRLDTLPVDKGQLFQDVNKFRNAAAPNVTGRSQLPATDNSPTTYGEWTVAWCWN